MCYKFYTINYTYKLEGQSVVANLLNHFQDCLDYSWC